MVLEKSSVTGGKRKVFFLILKKYKSTSINSSTEPIEMRFVSRDSLAGLAYWFKISLKSVEYYSRYGESKVRFPHVLHPNHIMLSRYHASSLTLARCARHDYNAEVLMRGHPTQTPDVSI